MKFQGLVSVIVLSLLFVGDSVAGPADLSVAGEIKSKSGLRFPDGSLQTRATQSREYANTYVVAKSGGDFESIQTAIDNITAWASAPVLVWVAPGV